MEVIDVQVGLDAAQVQADLAAALPGEIIRVSNLGPGLLLSGEVSNASIAARAKALAEKSAPEAVTSALTSRGLRGGGGPGGAGSLRPAAQRFRAWA